MSDTPEKLPDLTEYELPHHPWVLAGAVMIAPFMEVLDTTITNVALPHIAGNLSTSSDESTRGDPHAFPPQGARNATT